MVIQRDGQRHRGWPQQKVDELGALEVGGVVDPGDQQEGDDQGNTQGYRVKQRRAAQPLVDAHRQGERQQRDQQRQQRIAGQIDPQLIEFGHIHY